MTPRNSVEIVSPAGNLEKLRFAVRYGAGAVYFGGQEFNLRVKAGNFSSEELHEAVRFCRAHNVRTVFLMNAFLHENMVPDARAYLREVKTYGFDAIMVADPGMLVLVKEAGIDAEIHLSTQTSTLNSVAIQFWRDAGVSRIVMAREATLDEIKSIYDATGADLEVFAHGAVCVAYSGRCLLSRYLTGREANQGDCSQPCRWNFTLMEKKRPGNYLDMIEHGSGTEILSSKDLCLLEKLPEFIAAGVSAFKLEGRMKSLYYAANITRVYRHAASLAGTEAFEEFLPFWQQELDLVSHRPYTDDLFNEFNNMAFDGVPYINRARFLGYRHDEGDSSEEVIVKTFNPLPEGSGVEWIYPISENRVNDNKAVAAAIRDDSGKRVERANHGGLYQITFDRPVHRHGIVRQRM